MSTWRSIKIKRNLNINRFFLLEIPVILTELSHWVTEHTIWIRELSIWNRDLSYSISKLSN